MKALIIEDNPSLARFLKGILAKQGWFCDLSFSFSKAEELINKNFYHLFILDILLPDKDGFEALKIISQKKALEDLKIALISGVINPSSALKKIPQYLKSHCSFFKKPINEKTFLKFLKETQDFWAEKSKISLKESFFEKEVLQKPLSFYLSSNKTFDSKQLIFLVYTAHLKKFSGEFKIITENKSSIHFYKGDIVQITSNKEKTFLGALLVEHGLSLEEDIVHLLRNKFNQRIGEKLVEKELLSPYMLDFILKQQIKIRLSEIMSYPSFRLELTESSAKIEEPDVHFNKTNLMEWLAESLQTELTNKFFENFYLDIKEHSIQKSKPIAQSLISQKKFLKNYNLLFHTIKEGETVGDIINSPQNKYQILPFLYLGLLTKSIYLKNNKKAGLDEQKAERLLDSILEKDSEDLFSIFDLPWKASIKEVEKQYKCLIVKIHPDIFPDNADQHLKAKAEKALAIIIKSYNILKNETKRKHYFLSKTEKNNNIINKYEEGLIQIKKEEYESAYETLDSIAHHKQAPQNTFLYALWARLKSTNDNLYDLREEGVKIKKTIDHCPINLKADFLYWHVKGLFCFKIKKQYEQAQKFFKKSLAFQPHFAPAKKELVLVKQIIKKNKLVATKPNFLNSLLKKSS